MLLGTSRSHNLPPKHSGCQWARSLATPLPLLLTKNQEKEPKLETKVGISWAKRLIEFSEVRRDLSIWINTISFNNSTHFVSTLEPEQARSFLLHSDTRKTVTMLHSSQNNVAVVVPQHKSPTLNFIAHTPSIKIKFCPVLQRRHSYPNVSHIYGAQILLSCLFEALHKCESLWPQDLQVLIWFSKDKVISSVPTFWQDCNKVA